MARVIKNNWAYFTIVAVIFVMMTLWIFSNWSGPLKVIASPDEALTNGSFDSGTTGWTLDTTVYDDATYHGASAGSIQTQTAVGRNKTATGTCTHNNSISTNSGDTIILSLYWKKEYVGAGMAEIHTISVQIQTAGGDWSSPTTIWTHTTAGTFDWTLATSDVSSYFDTGSYDFRYYMDLENPNKSDAQTTAWVDTTSLDITGAVVSVVVTDGVVNYGILPLSGTEDTTAAGRNDTQHAQNDGSGTEKFNIMGSNSTPDNWTLAASRGTDQYFHEFSTDGSTWTALTTSYLTLDTSVAQNATVDFDLRVGVPSTTSAIATQDIDVTIQAVAP